MTEAKRAATAAEMVEETRVAEKYARKLIRRLRVRVADRPGQLAAVLTAIGADGAETGEIERLSLDSTSAMLSVTIYVDNTEQLERLVGRVQAVAGATVEAVTDVVLELHRGGKLRIAARTKVRTLQDLQMIYTPGVASVCLRIHREEPEVYRKYTWVGNTVAIVTDGSAVLGLGNIGPRAALPVMEGKAVILDQLAGVGCVPIILDTQDAGEIIRTVEHLAAGFGVIMLEDIAAPKCFEIEQTLAKRLPMPVFHDDQHGTAVVILAALENACRQAKRKLGELKIVILGSGAAGGATARLLLGAGAKHIVCCDRAGAIYRGRTDRMDTYKEQLAEITNTEGVRGSLAEVMKGAEVFIGVSGKGLVSAEMVRSMAAPRIVLALANPDPEIPPREAIAAGATVALDGRTVNNALAFPGIIRGTLDSGAREITESMKVAAARASPAMAPEGLLLPLILDPAVHQAVAKAVAGAAGEKIKN